MIHVEMGDCCLLWRLVELGPAVRESQNDERQKNSIFREWKADPKRARLAFHSTRTHCSGGAVLMICSTVFVVRYHEGPSTSKRTSRTAIIPLPALAGL